MSEKMLLAVSITSRAVEIGCVNGEGVCATLSLSADKGRSADEYALLLRDLLAFHGYEVSDFSHAMLSSVEPSLTDTVREALSLTLGARVFTLGAGSKTGLSIRTDDPAELGSDLVAAAVGALSLYPPPLFLVSFGTATVLSAIDRNGAFIGCAIAPGLSVASSALADEAALLHAVTAKAPAAAIGKNTEDSLRSGAVLGAAAMIDGLLSRMEAEMGEEGVPVIASGKLSDAIMPHTLRPFEQRDDLVFLGLYEIDKKSKKR